MSFNQLHLQCSGFISSLEIVISLFLLSSIGALIAIAINTASIQAKLSRDSVEVTLEKALEELHEEDSTMSLGNDCNVQILLPPSSSMACQSESAESVILLWN